MRLQIHQSYPPTSAPTDITNTHPNQSTSGRDGNMPRVVGSERRHYPPPEGNLGVNAIHILDKGGKRITKRKHRKHRKITKRKHKKITKRKHKKHKKITKKKHRKHKRRTKKVFN
jgi:hypothetical protein